MLFRAEMKPRIYAQSSFWSWVVSGRALDGGELAGSGSEWDICIEIEM